MLIFSSFVKINPQRRLSKYEHAQSRSTHSMFRTEANPLLKSTYLFTPRALCNVLISSRPHSEFFGHNYFLQSIRATLPAVSISRAGARREGLTLAFRVDSNLACLHGAFTRGVVRLRKTARKCVGGFFLYQKGCETNEYVGRSNRATTYFRILCRESHIPVLRRNLGISCKFQINMLCRLHVP